MAVSEITTVIANPAARKRRKRNVGLPRSASLKQKLHFGTPRQRAAAELSLKRSRAAKRRKRVNRGGLKKQFHRQKKHGPSAQTIYKGARSFDRKAARARGLSMRKNSPRKHKRKHNPGEIIALTSMNPAKRRKTSMARTHRRRRHASRNAGRRHNPAPRARHVRHHRRRQHNPGQVAGMVRSAVAAGVGFLGSKIATQAVLGSGNTGFMGYFGNAVATGILSWGTHAFTKNKMDAFMVGVGGTLNILGRIIADNSLLGQYSSQLGMGDYLVANWWVPQRLDGDPFSLTNQQYDMSWMPQPQIPIASAAPPGMGYLPAPIPSVYGNDLY